MSASKKKFNFAIDVKRHNPAGRLTAKARRALSSQRVAFFILVFVGIVEQVNLFGFYADAG